MMMKKSFYFICAVFFLVIGLSSCLKSREVPKIEYKREVLGSVKVNGKDFEHAVYIANAPVQSNPYLFYSERMKMVYFPIALTPKGGEKQVLPFYYVYFYLNLENGIPELYKPYTIKRNEGVEEVTAEEFEGLFVHNRKRILEDGSDGVAIVYNRDSKKPNQKISAEGSITFTSFDVEKRTCTATYQLMTTEKPELPVLNFQDGEIKTLIYTQSVM